MIYNGKEVAFPAKMMVSFFKLIEKLEEQSKQKEDIGLANYAKELLKEIEQYPALKDGIENIGDLKKYDQPIKKLSRLLFPDSLQTNEIKLLSPPFYFEPILTSTRFDTIIKASGEPFSFTMKDVDEDTFYLYCCYFILASYYGYPITLGTPQLLEIFNQNQGIMRTYKMLINADLSEFMPTETAIDITEKDYQELMENFKDIDLWKKKFPPNSWIMRGVNIVNLVDVTQDDSIGKITANLLVKETDTFQKIQSGIRRLLGKPTIEIGVLTLQQKRLIPLDKGDIKSLLLQSGESLDCKNDMCQGTYDLLIDRREPLIITDAKTYIERSEGRFALRVKESKYNSYLSIPLIHEDELLGYMEIGAQKSYELHKGTLELLKEVLPILAMAHKRFITEAQNLIEAIIQQECTTIHPSVKWRFEEEAKKFLTRKMNGEQPVFKDITFENLYPLYGQLDIKGSSERRNKAVSADLLKQIDGVFKVLKTAHKTTEMPAYEELIFRLNNYKVDLKNELSAGSEHEIMNFLKTHIYPVMDHLQENNVKFVPLIQEYESSLDPELGTIYEERKKYDLSVNTINQRLANYLDNKQVEAQKMFPHYFERYKTDGVEFNMYIGQSISENHTFDQIYLRNLRLWQLLVMCEMEQEFATLQKELHTDIEVASLILVHSNPLSVHFRMDEKQFDVEGAYNARYEIIKKRVDKANIKGTNERITRPGSIVIVYSQQQDAIEYQNYLRFLASKGYLKEGIEDLHLEDLQGVHGLHALRVDVAYSGNLSLEELMEEIEHAPKN